MNLSDMAKNKILSLMEEKKISKKELAERLGQGMSAVSHTFNKKHQISFDKFKKYLSACGYELVGFKLRKIKKQRRAPDILNLTG